MSADPAAVAELETIHDLGAAAGQRAKGALAEGAALPADLPLSQNRDFKIVLAGQSISALGDAVSFTTVPLLVLALTGSGAAMGTVGALQALPDLILGLPAGALADRWDRRRMMIWADVGRAALTALVPLAVLLHWDTLAVIFVVTAPINTLRVLFLAAWTGAVPSLVGRSQVGRAFGYSEAIFSLSFIVGPGIAGILVGIIGPGQTLAIDALSFLVSAASLRLVQRPMQLARAPAATHLVAEIAQGVGYILHQPTLRVVILFASLVSVAGASLVNAVIYLLKVEQGMSSGVVGLVLSVYSVGYALGAILAGRYAKRRLGLVMLKANAASAGFIVIFVLFPDPIAQAVGALGAGASGALWLIGYITMRATITPDHLLGRVGSTARMLSIGLSSIGVLTGGVLLDAIHGRSTLLLMAAGLLLISGTFALSPTMRRAVSGSPHA